MELQKILTDQPTGPVEKENATISKKKIHLEQAFNCYVIPTEENWTKTAGGACGWSKQRWFWITPPPTKNLGVAKADAQTTHSQLSNFSPLPWQRISNQGDDQQTSLCKGPKLEYTTEPAHGESWERHNF